MKRNDLIRRLKYYSAVITLCTSMSVTGCSKSDTSFNTTMYGVYDNTCFDELVGEDFIKEIVSLEEYVNISDKLSTLGLTDNTNSKDYSNLELLNYNTLKILIEDFENKNFENISYDDLNAKLYVQRKLVDEYLYNNGYSIMAYASLNCVKARVADTVGMSLNEAKNLTIMDKESYDIATSALFSSILIDGYDVSKSNIPDLMESIYNMQHNENNISKSERVTYNKDRNKFLKKALDNLKTCLSSEYRVDTKKRIRNK